MAPEGLRAVYQFECTEAECVAALQFDQARLFKRASRAPPLFALRSLVFASFLCLVYFASRLVVTTQNQGAGELVLSLIAFVFLVILWQTLLRRSVFAAAAASDGTLGGRRVLTIEEWGLRSRREGGETNVAWDGIRAVEDLGGLLLVYLDEATSLPIPSSAFSSAEERAHFLAELQRRRGAEPLPRIERHEISVPAESSQRSQVFRALLDGLRMALFLRTKSAPGASWSTLVGLVGLAILPSFVIFWLGAGPKPQLNSTALAGALFGLPLLLACAWAMAAGARQPHRTLPLLIALIGLSIPIDLIGLALGMFGPSMQYLHLLAPSWLAAAAAVAAIRLLAMPRASWAAYPVLAAFLVGLPLVQAAPDRTFWYRSDLDETESRREPLGSVVREESFYLQPKLLERELASLQPGRRGVVDLYFIGVAAYASQDVFMKEVRAVKKLFDERFDTAGRSLALINNAATAGQAPIATATSLGLALKRVGEVMDRDEDILFLFIASHGSKDHRATFEFPPLQLDQVDPPRLKKLLDESRIERRVVVVSACYSGAFVDALQGDKTLVISASAADKNSFGCSNDADFTYFDRAYFDEALRETYSFTTAFEMAVPVIARREREASFSGSSPQMFVGEGIKRPLEEFVRSRQAATGKR